MTIESASTKIRANLHRLNFVAVLLAVNKRTIQRTCNRPGAPNRVPTGLVRCCLVTSRFLPVAKNPPERRRLGSYCASEAAELIAAGTQAMPSTPFVSRMGSSTFQSLRFRISIVPPWGQLT
jgi:hypothetical protein